MIVSGDMAVKREEIRWEREREAKVGAGVWMWWTDWSRSDNGRVEAATLCQHGDIWKAFRCHVGTGRMEVYDAERWAIGLALRESVKMRKTLSTHKVMKGGIISDWQVAIRRREHLEARPAQAVARWINRSASTLRAASIEIVIHCILGHIGTTGKEEADR
jgi:hypothetical protein